MLRRLSWRSEPSLPKASASKKHHTDPPVARNSLLLVRSCWWVVNTVRSLVGWKLSTSLHGALAQLGTCRGRREPLDRHEPVALVAIDLRGR